MDKAADTENTGEGTMQREIVGAGPNSAAFATSTLPQEELERMTGDIVAALKTVYDPEIPADIYELGLIYRVDIDDDRTVHVQMTLTAPGCPVAGEMPMWVQQAISGVEGVMDVDGDLVFDPAWTPERMSEEAQIAVGMW